MNMLASVLRAEPKDAEAQALLGDCYLAAGDYAAAFYLYTQAIALGGSQAELERRLALARAERVRMEPHVVAPVPTEPESVARLLQSLTGRPNPITETELERAAGILGEILNSANPAETVAAHLGEIDSLLPALLELNLRQARADGRHDLAEALNALLENIQLQLTLSATPSAQPSPATETISAPTRSVRGAGARVLFISADTHALVLPALALRGLGCEVMVASEVPPGNDAAIAITHNPHSDPAQLQHLRACKLAGAKVLVYFDCAVQYLPDTHPAYPRLALNSPAREHAYFTALQLADRVIVSSVAMAEAFENAIVIPPGWSRRNPLWEAPVPARTTVNIGWAASSDELGELAEVRRAVIRILREFPHTRLVTIGDHRAHHLFNALPEDRRQFIPLVSEDELPYLLGQLDVLLVPLRANDFNRTQTDERLVQAGARRVAWLASPIPAHLAWGVGGLIAAERDEWYSQLRKLVVSGELRAMLAQVGRQRAEEREMARLGMAWLEVIEAVQAERHVLGGPAANAPRATDFARQLEALAR